MGLLKGAAVYTLTINQNEKSYIYVGSTKDIEKRMVVHLKELAKGVHHSELLQKAYTATKRKPFLEILETPRQLEERIESESRYIDYFKQFDDVIICNTYKPCTYAPRVYLNIKQVQAVKRYLRLGKQPRKVAEITGVKLKQVYLIKGGFRWPKVKG